MGPHVCIVETQFLGVLDSEPHQVEVYISRKLVIWSAGHQPAQKLRWNFAGDYLSQLAAAPFQLQRANPTK